MTAVTAAGPARRRAAGSRRPRWLWLALVVAAAAALTGVLGVGLGRDPSVVNSVLLSRPAPPLVGRTLDGAALNLGSYRGRLVLVNVWASWCAACRAEHPVLAAAQRDLGPRGLQVVGIDMSDKPADARRFLAELGGASWPSVVDPDARIAISWGTFAVPETYVVDARGTIVEKAVGAVTTNWIATRVVPRLAR